MRIKHHTSTLMLIIAPLLLVACRVDPLPSNIALAPQKAAQENNAQLNPIVVAIATKAPTSTPTSTPTPTPPPATATAEPTIIPTASNLPCDKNGTIAYGSFASQIAGPQRNYRIYLPPCYGEDGRVYPTIYLLHGNVRVDNEWDEIGIDDSAEILIQAGQLPPSLIVMPNGYAISDNSSGGPWSYEAVIIDELMPHIEATWCASHSAENRAIGGLSRGGYWSLQIAFRHPDKFAAAASHSGSFLDSSTDVTINPLYTATRNDLSNLRIAIDYGGDDPFRFTGNPLHESLLAAEIAHDWQVHPSGGHDDFYWRTHAEAYLKWYSQNWSQARFAYAACQLQP